MKVAILGLPQSGRTTLYRYLSGTPINQERLPKQAALDAIDERLQKLTEDSESDKTTKAEFILFDSQGDIVSDGRCMDPVRPADALIWQFRGFDEGFGEPNPVEDYQMLREIALEKDKNSLQNRLENIEKSLSRGIQGEERKKLEREKKAVEKMLAQIEEDKPVRLLELDENELKYSNNFGLITAKPALVHISCDEDHYSKLDDYIEEIKSVCKGELNRIDFAGSTPLFELELAELDEDEIAMFREEAGIMADPVKEIIEHVFHASEQEVFLTTGPKESRAWLIKKGATAVEAADVIHSDIAQGFIRAEVLAWDDYEKAGSYKEAKSQGKIRLEGKDYVVKDGDIILFRFNV
ncbi:MAG: DUF933 domain-containing protein [Candidatus Zixiibacteriota bacterium]